jgi:SpoVK/Ycf46/Vps4 family AAA+-type ATPase
MEGLSEVKESVRQLLEVVIQNADRDDDEKPLLHVALNRIFVGNPGTGKTTVAKLYARILADLGLLSKGEVIVKNPSDFKGAVLGNSEAQTRAILESAMGSVLVIDEAYGLCPSTKGKFCLLTIRLWL